MRSRNEFGQKYWTTETEDKTILNEIKNKDTFNLLDKRRWQHWKNVAHAAMFSLVAT